MRLLPVILSGGAGSRLWPLSRAHFPKQLLALAGEQTMLQATATRLEGLEGVDLLPPVVVCNENHRFSVAEQLRQVGCRPGAIILEPVGRNTAPALTLAALHAERAGLGECVLLVMAADHVIKDRIAFHRALLHGLALCRNDGFVTFGIVPDVPETGYGYIRRGRPSGEHGYLVESFVEKPDAATARHYLNSGEYYWNSGMFMLRPRAWLAALEEFRPDIGEAVRAAFQQASEDRDFFRLERESFEACPSDSIDYAVMEKLTGSRSGQLAVVPLEAGWSDVGSWSALWQVNDKDEQGNVVKGDTMVKDCRDSLVISEHRLVACLGLEELVVVETADAVLVAHKDRSQDVKRIVNRLEREKRNESETHRWVPRPWGAYECIDAGNRFQVKRITVKPGAALSLQLHHHRAEHWIVVKGTARVTCGSESRIVSENQSTYIPLGTPHRLENPGVIPLELIEVQSGSYLGEDDIVRFDDHYGR